MRIVYIHQYFASRDMAGGTRSFELARRLVAAGHDVTVITTDRRREAERGWRTTDESGVRVQWYGLPYDNGFGFLRRVHAFLVFSVAALLRGTRERPDVVFATSTPLTVAIPGVLIARRRRCRFVFEVRDLWPELPIAVGALRNPLLIGAARWLERFAYRNADAIVALSPGMADGVRAVNGDRAPIEVIPNSCDIDLFRDLPCPEEPALPAALEGRPYALYAGTFGAMNEVGYIVDVARHARDRRSRIAFLLIGDGAHRRAVEAKARSLAVLGDNLFVLDPIPKKRLVAIYRRAAACLSLFGPVREMENNSANKFFDALAAGRPVAINYGGWQASLLEEYSAGIRLDRDPRAAAGQLAALVEDEQRTLRYAEGARALSSRFDRDALAERFERVVTGASAHRGMDERRTA